MKQNINVKIYRFAKEFLFNNLPDEITENDLNKYMTVSLSKQKNLKDVFVIFIHSAQNYQRTPKVIKFHERKSKIEKILFGFDYKKIAEMDEERLYKTFRKTFMVTSKDSKMNSWYKWSCSIVDCARFLCGFKNIPDFDRFVKRFDYNPETRMALPLMISTKIRGMGFALACNALKELGYVDYPKPDVHIIDICETFGLSSRNPYDAFEAIVRIAKDNNVTPYEVDKVLWLICSGNYYLDEIKVKSKKEEFINELKIIL